MPHSVRAAHSLIARSLRIDPVTNAFRSRPFRRRHKFFTETVEICVEKCRRAEIFPRLFSPSSGLHQLVRHAARCQSIEQRIISAYAATRLRRDRSARTLRLRRFGGQVRALNRRR